MLGPGPDATVHAGVGAGVSTAGVFLNFARSAGTPASRLGCPYRVATGPGDWLEQTCQLLAGEPNND